MRNLAEKNIKTHHRQVNITSFNEYMDRMSRPCANGGIWGDAFIMKFITFCLDKALHLWDIRPILKTYSII
jgi:hypothetical protein